MSQIQENPECTADQGETSMESQSVEVAQVFKEEDESSSSPRPLETTTQKGWAQEETGCPASAQVSGKVKKPCSSPHPLVPTSWKGKNYKQNQGQVVAQVSEKVKEPLSPLPSLLTCSPKDESYKEIQGLEVAQVSGDVQEPSCPSQQLGASSLKADLMHETPSTSQGPESSSDSGVAAAASSPNQVGEVPSGQQAQIIPFKLVQGAPFHLPIMPVLQHTPDDHVSKKADFLVNYMLYKYQMRQLMSMEDMVRIVIGEDESHFHKILTRANDRMEMVFGLEVREVDATDQMYGLFIKLGLTYDGMHADKYSFPKTGFLILILGLVFLKGNRVTEEEIWESLNPMGIFAGVPHLLFGDPRELITKEFVREQYLECKPVHSSFPVRYEYVWGPRAYAETSKMKVLEYVAKLHGTHPSVFQSHYEEALLEEEERKLAVL